MSDPPPRATAQEAPGATISGKADPSAGEPDEGRGETAACSDPEPFGGRVSNAVSSAAWSILHLGWTEDDALAAYTDAEIRERVRIALPMELRRQKRREAAAPATDTVS